MKRNKTLHAPRPRLSKTWRVAATGVLLLAILGGCGDPEIVVPELMTIVALLPSHGATQIGTDVQALAYFSHPAASEAAVEGSFTLRCLGAPVNDDCTEPEAAGCDEEEPPASVTYDSANQVARLIPAADLQNDACYVLVVQAGIEAAEANVGALPVDVRSSFRTE